MIARLASFLVSGLAGGAAAVALLWTGQREIWGFDALDPEHWRYLEEAWQGPGIRLDFAASFLAAVLLWGALWWGMARAIRIARSAMPWDRRRARPPPAPASAAGTGPQALRDRVAAPDAAPASPASPAPAPDAPDAEGSAPDEPDGHEEEDGEQAPPPGTADEGHALAVNAARERGFYAYPDPAGAPGFAVAGLAAGRILLIAPFDPPGRWTADPGTGAAAWLAEDGAEAPCPVAAAAAALAAFEAEHATALEGFEVYLVESVVLVTAATLEDAGALAAEIEDRTGGRVALAGLVDRGDGLPRLDGTIQRADQALAVREDLAGYVRRNIA